MNTRAATSNDPRRIPVSGRTALGRRILDLADGYAAQLGGWPALGDVLAANVRKAAELVALAEQTRADALRNGNVDPVAVVRLEGAANRAVRALHLDRKRESEQPSLGEYLARTSAGAPPAAQGRKLAPEVPSNEERISDAPDGLGEAAA